MTQSPSLLDRLHRAMNDGDLDDFLDCFADDFRCEQPAHPTNGYHGKAYVRATWANVFNLSPDFEVDLSRSFVDDDVIWVEWSWYDVPTGSEFIDVSGVCVFGVEDGRLGWGRLYMEPVRSSQECFVAEPARMREASGEAKK